MALFDRFKGALQKTRTILRTDVRDLFKSGEILDEEQLERFHRGLITADMGVRASGELVEQIRREHGGRTVDPEAIWASVESRLRTMLAGEGQESYDTEQPLSPLARADDGPTVVLVAGVNGVGKTTSIAKLAYLLHSSGQRVLLAAGDTFRAAAVEQLSLWADRIGCEIVTGPPKADPASVAFEACRRGRDEGFDFVVIDTAGRLQTQTNLMDELGKIRRVVGKSIEGAPHEALLVLDATTGQNGLSQAEKFSEAIGCTGIILTKLDGSARGGVVVAIRGQSGLPVKYVGLGEQIDQLAVFDADAFARALVAQ